MIVGTGSFASAAANQSSQLANVRLQFLNPGDDARIAMRWWWFGSSVEQPELERELRVMKAAGVGGVEIQPVYPLELDEPEKGIRNLPYLSTEFRKDIGFVSDLTAKLGMRMNVTLGSGWPFGGPHTPIIEAAGRLRIERISISATDTSTAIPALENGESLIAAYLANGERRQISAVGAQRLDDISNGRVRFRAGSNPRVLVFFVASHTGQQVKRAAVGAEGYVLDHYNRAAINHHLKEVAEPLLQSFGDSRPYSVFSDSLEVFGSDWTTDFLPEFKRRRGYDLSEHLIALVADDDPDARSIRHDWGKTLTALVEDNYLKPVRNWAHEHGTLFRSQTYGEPPAILSSNDLVDLPEGEAGTRWRTFSTARWASSASHIYNRPVTSTETWTWLHSPAFRATPLDMKAEADLHFLQGINQLVGHGWPYSPERAGEPGWRFYAAAVFNEHNPWFQVMPEITVYLQRLSALLRQGKPSNDIAVYLPTDDAWANFKPGHPSVDRQMETALGPDLIPQILDAGYNFDFVDDRALASLFSSSARLPWKVVVVPGVERMPLSSARLLNKFVQEGGRLIATKRLPSLAPGFLEAKADSPQVAEMTHRWRLIEQERELGETLNQLYRPDLHVGKSVASAIGFIHRKLDDSDIYFIANTSNRDVRDEATFRISLRGCERWDPFSGDTRPMPTRREGDFTILPLQLAPYESEVVVFSNSISVGKAQFEKRTSSSELLNDSWKLTFSRTQKIATFATLHSWADDDETKFYSGEVIYERDITIPKTATSVSLDFGPGTIVEPSGPANTPGMRALLESPVRESALVFLNGKKVGSVWHPPYVIDLGRSFHAGSNHLRIVVANTAINEIAGMALPTYKLLNLRYGERFVPQGYDGIAPLPSGMLGPVRLNIK